MIPVTLLMAITVDGKIAKDKNQFANWTSKEDKKLFVETSKEFGVIMMGENTFKTFPKPLPGRLNVVFSHEGGEEIGGLLKWVSGEPELVLDELGNLGYKKALLGGGAGLNTLFLKKKLISEIILTVEPKIFGSGISLFSEDIDADLELQEHRLLNENTLMLRYKIIYPS
ncbi:dihydrofolate reductase [Candidatus Falkowbacteria bacterium HGW-Falkowbacteria-2]|uniref:Dihydrofolate reductase n=1 Tax=Candidatus Falkowbacteria bacterium HGW-Falkowbacteria-2 TaxID=2013769 RepID=A0A2N2DYF0_9BACT|nr:MAG: dihydrofolate reductase [Candidatus Falkowbacteria bacterium HGW-Falkowbacteria-2]